MLRKFLAVAFVVTALGACGGNDEDLRDRNAQAPSAGAAQQGVACKKAGRMVITGTTRFGCATTTEGKKWVLVGDFYKGPKVGSCYKGNAGSVVSASTVTGCFWDRTSKPVPTEIRRFNILSLVESLKGSAPPVASVAVVAATTTTTPPTTTPPTNAAGSPESTAVVSGPTTTIPELTASDTPGIEVVRSYADGVLVKFTVPESPTAPLDGYGIEISPACSGCSVETVEGNVMKVVGLPRGVSHTIAAYSTSGPRFRSPLSTPVAAGTYDIGSRGPGGGLVYRAERIPAVSEVRRGTPTAGQGSRLVFNGDTVKPSRFWTLAAVGNSMGEPPALLAQYASGGRLFNVEVVPTSAGEFATEDSKTKLLTFVTLWLISVPQGSVIKTIAVDEAQSNDMQMSVEYRMFSCLDEQCAGVREALGAGAATSYSEVASGFVPGGPVEWSKAKSTAAAYKGGGLSGWRLLDSDMQGDSTAITEKLKWKGSGCPEFMAGARVWSEFDAGESAFGYECGDDGLVSILTDKTEWLPVLAVRDF